VVPSASGSWEPTGSLVKLLAWRAEERPQFGLLYVEGDGPWSVGAIAAASHRLAGRLGDAGVGTGDRVLVRLGNDERFLAALAGVLLRGAAAIVMHPSAPGSDVIGVVASMGAVALVCDPGDRAGDEMAIPVLALARLAQGDPAPWALEVPDVADAAEALILLTSGSTGAPKGVLLSHGNGWANLRATVSAFRSHTAPGPLPTEPKPPNLIANPVSHTAGVVRLLFALYVGRSVVLLRKFDAGAAKAAIDRHGIDNMTINPTMMRMLLEELDPAADLGAVRYVSSGTAPLPAALREAFEARFGVPVLQAYGQTEAFGGVAIESVRDVLAGLRRPGSVGRPLPGVDLKIMGEAAEAAAGADGEVWVRSRSATTGYVGGDGGPRPVDLGGWLHTGDLGHLDADGYLYITGRLKNIIICGGFNIVPEEVEAALMADERVREAVVVGLPDDRLGEVPVAVVEADDRPAAILGRVSPRLAPYKRPRRILLVDHLPRVPNGKVDLRAATAMAARAEDPVDFKNI
jgi:acyl-CoA synthetase (AMP-forming)/AMP-acid ligase II